MLKLTPHNAGNVGLTTLQTAVVVLQHHHFTREQTAAVLKINATSKTSEYPAVKDIVSDLCFRFDCPSRDLYDTIMEVLADTASENSEVA